MPKRPPAETALAASPPTGPPRTGYVLKRFPRLSETFIVHEILELERQGVGIEIFALTDPADPVQHEALRRLQAPVTYLPQDDWAQAAQTLHGSYARGQGAPATPQERARTWPRQALVAGHSDPHLATLTVKAAALAVLASSRGISHLHAHFASDAATVARLASRITGVPYSFTAHAKDIYHDIVDGPSLQRKLREAAFVVTVCEHNRRHLVELIGEAGAHHVKLIYNGVDLRFFRPELEPDSERNLILGVGRLVEKKGFRFLLEACRILRDQGQAFRCDIVGQGELHGQLRQQIEEAGLQERVRLVGPCSQEELRRYYRQAALLVMPCVVAQDGNRDALPTVMLEAMACGLPVVATRVTGNPEIVEHGRTGFVVEPERAEELAEAVARLLTESALRAELGLAGRQRAEARFDLKENVRRLHQLLVARAAGSKVA